MKIVFYQGNLAIFKFHQETCHLKIEVFISALAKYIPKRMDYKKTKFPTFNFLSQGPRLLPTNNEIENKPL